jgi:hypothetical protein
MSDIVGVNELLAVSYPEEEIPRHERWGVTFSSSDDCETHALAVTKLLHWYLFQASFSIERCRNLDKTKPKPRVEGLQSRAHTR